MARLRLRTPSTTSAQTLEEHVTIGRDVSESYLHINETRATTLTRRMLSSWPSTSSTVVGPTTTSTKVHLDLYASENNNKML